MMNDDVNRLQERLKASKQQLQKREFRECLTQLRALQREIREKLSVGQWGEGEHDRLLEMQVMVFNNLACLFENQGKYKSSLYHLEVAQRLQTAHVTQKYKDAAVPSTIIEQLSTTYSNLSAVRSKLGQFREATSDIEFAIKIMKGDPTLSEHSSLAYLYYNYAFLLSTAGKPQQAIECAQYGLQVAMKRSLSDIVEKLEKLVSQLKRKAERMAQRQEKYLLKYIKGETGVFKTVDSLKNNDVCLEKLPRNQAVKVAKVTFFRPQYLFQSPHPHSDSLGTPQSAQEKFGTSITKPARRTSYKAHPRFNMTRSEQGNRSHSESHEKGRQIFQAYGMWNRSSQARERIRGSRGGKGTRGQVPERGTILKTESQSQPRGGTAGHGLQKIIERLYLTENR